MEQLEQLMIAVFKNNLAEVKELAPKTEVNVHTHIGDTPLMAAIRNDLLEVVQILLENGANPDFPNIEGWYPIHFATQENNLQIVELLVKHGAVINRQDGRFGNTPLHTAIAKSDRALVDYFLQLGLDVNIPNKSGVTVADFAKMIGVTLE